MKQKLTKIKNTIKNYNPPFIIWMLFTILCLILVLIFNKNFNNDTWFILNHGRYVVNHGIPYIEPFSIHENFEFVMQQWLTSVIFWCIYSTLGKVGISIFVLLISSLIMYVIYKIGLLLSNSNFRCSIIITLVIFLFLSIYLVGRPQIFTYLILLLEIYILEKYIKTKNKKILLILPILSILLINLHASMWWMMIVFMLPYIVESFVKNKENINKKDILLILLLMFICGFINPYGLDAITYLFNSYGVSEINNFVGEMCSIEINDLVGACYYIVIFLVLLIYYKYIDKEKLKLRYTLFLLGTIVLALSSYKSFPYFIFASIIPLTYYLKNIVTGKKKTIKNYSKKYQKIYILCCLITMISSSLSLYWFHDILQPSLFKEDKYLRSAITYLRNNTEVENITLYNGYDEGAIPEFYGIKCYIDPRAEVFLKANNKKEDIFEEYVRLQMGLVNYRKFINKYKFTHMLIEKKDTLNIYIDEAKDYKKVYSNKQYKIYERIN